MKIIVGLGNPGMQYAKSRHNIGFLFVDYIAWKNNLTFKEKTKFKAYVVEYELDGEKILLVKPTTFMNNSGESIVALENFYKIGFENFLICYDDIDLPFFTLRFRSEGSAGTHNGMRSILALTGTNNVPRLRFGIDVEDRKAELRSFVLNDFSKDEESKIEDFLSAGLDLMLDKFISTES